LVSQKDVGKGSKEKGGGGEKKKKGLIPLEKKKERKTPHGVFEKPRGKGHIIPKEKGKGREGHPRFRKNWLGNGQ